MRPLAVPTPLTGFLAVAGLFSLAGLLALAGPTSASVLATPPSEHSEALAPIKKILDEGNAKRAVDLLESLIKAGHASAESHYLLGLALQVRLDEVGLLSKRKISGQLKQTLELAIDLDPKHVGAHEELADFYYFAPGIVGGSKKKASAQIAALARFSAYDALRVRGRHAFNGDDFREAESLFTQALALATALDGSNAEIWYLRGMARQKVLEKDEAALDDFRQALELGYPEPVLHYQIGRLCVRLETCATQGEESLKLFIASSEGRNRAFGHYRLAQLFEQAERLQDARNEARASLQIEPELDAVIALLKRVEGKLKAKGSSGSL